MIFLLTLNVLYKSIAFVSPLFVVNNFRLHIYCGQCGVYFNLNNLLLITVTWSEFIIIIISKLLLLIFYIH